MTKSIEEKRDDAYRDGMLHAAQLCKNEFWCSPEAARDHDSVWMGGYESACDHLSIAIERAAAISCVPVVAPSIEAMGREAVFEKWFRSYTVQFTHIFPNAHSQARVLMRDAFMEGVALVVRVDSTTEEVAREITEKWFEGSKADIHERDSLVAIITDTLRASQLSYIARVNEAQNEAGETAAEPEDYIIALKAEVARLRSQLAEAATRGFEAAREAAKSACDEVAAGRGENPWPYSETQTEMATAGKSAASECAGRIAALNPTPAEKE